MKHLFFAFALLLGGLFAPALHAGSGGPDAYGYIWKDSNEPGGPVFSWVDIRSKVDAVPVTGLGDDNSAGQYNIGWDFHYYWSDHNKVKIGSNGWISFDNAGNVAACFPTIPTAGGAADNLVAPFLSDLTFNSNSSQDPNIGTVHYWTNNIDSFIVQYTDVPWWKNSTPDWAGANTFQVILSGQDSSITFQYLNTDPTNLAVAGSCAQSMVIGMENLTGSIGLQVASGNQAAVPGDNYAVRFDYPQASSFQVPDAAPLWAANAENAGQFVLVNQPFSLQTNIGNVGNFPLAGNIAVVAKVKSFPAQTQVYGQTKNISGGLQPGQDTLLTFGSALNLSATGQYSYEITTTNSHDINANNNTTVVELAAVKQIGGAAMLSYCTGGLPDGGVSWSGGNQDDGVAVKIVPPAYPMTLDSLSFFVLGDDANPATPMPNGFEIKVYGSDGNGNVDLNNLLLAQTVAAQDVIEDNWNRILLSSPATITSGAVFVAWLQGGSGISLATESLGPISRRSFEILNGSWAPYRENSNNELLIQAAVSLPVGTSEPVLDAIEMTIHPNPNEGIFGLSATLPNAGDAEIVICDMLGKPVWSNTFRGAAPGTHQMGIDLQHLPAGMYFLTLSSRGKQATRKIIIE